MQGHVQDYVQVADWTEAICAIVDWSRDDLTMMIEEECLR